MQKSFLRFFEEKKIAKIFSSNILRPHGYSCNAAQEAKLLGRSVATKSLAERTTILSGGIEVRRSG